MSRLPLKLGPSKEVPKHKAKYFGSITTFEKIPALRDLLQSLVDHGYAGENYIWHIADDGGAQPYFSNEKQVDMPSAKEVYEEFKPKFHKLVFQYGKEQRLGIGANKNRGIKYFLDNTEAEFCMLYDDDIIMVAPGFFEELEQVLKENTSDDPVTGRYSLNHISGYWTDYPGKDYFDNTKKQMMSQSRTGWFDDFPVEALGNRGLEWRKGTMGCSNFYTRKALQDILFMDVFSKYGFEHTCHSARSLLRTDRRSPALYSMYDMCSFYYCGNQICNNYTDSFDEVQKADPLFQDRMNLEIARGLRLKVKDPGFLIEDETILE